MFKCFVFDGELLVGAGRAVADGIDCFYRCDVAVHPGNRPMRTAMAIFRNRRQAIDGGLVGEE